MKKSKRLEERRKIIYKDKPYLNYIKMKWERYPLVITVLGFVIIGFLVSVVKLIYHLIIN